MMTQMANIYGTLSLQRNTSWQQANESLCRELLEVISCQCVLPLFVK